jgi:catechol 2,3-dioxygenase-like lactoylglutathione lyase family enzyme
MRDHISLSVANYTASRDFYAMALRPLGYALAMEFGQAAGFGIKGKPDFWIAGGKPQQPIVHVAFASPDRATVDAFYRAAIAAGGKDNGLPGLRPRYHPAYYAAFVLDPDGNNIEAVCHTPE